MYINIIQPSSKYHRQPTSESLQKYGLDSETAISSLVSSSLILQNSVAKDPKKFDGKVNSKLKSYIRLFIHVTFLIYHSPFFFT